MEKEEVRTELKKYYKIVKICSICKQEYGIDKEKRENGICPVCENKLNDKKGMLVK